MVVNFTLISTKADCETLIELATKEKANLEFRKQSLQRQRGSAADHSLSVEAELQSIMAQVTAVQSIVANLPEGNVKEEMTIKLKSLEYKQFQLTVRRNNYGIVDLVEKDYDIDCVDQLIAATDAYLARLNDRLRSF